MKISARYSHLLFSGVLSVIMVTVISGSVVFFTQGLTPEFLHSWFKGFATAWPVAFPTLLIVAPLVKKFVARLTVPA